MGGNIRIKGDQRMTKRSYIKYDIECRVCKKVFQVPACKKESAKYCSAECRQQGVKKTIETSCGFCGKSMTTLPCNIKKSSSGLVFCSNICVGKYNSKIDKEKRVKKKCLICDREYSVKPCEAETSVSCSRECQSIWQSKFLTGKNANGYKHEYTDDMRLHKCYWCDKEYKLKAPITVRKKIENKPLFCSKECYREWYAKEWSQQEEWRTKSREKTIKMIKNGQFKKLNTMPHKIISNLLDEMGINHANEYDCKYFVTDIYLPESNLMIEINGDYWHCNPLKYSNIKYKAQYDRIVADKAKKTYIKNNYGINILYLWELDINNSIELCKDMIIEYINKKGNLNDYHSFNYNRENNQLKLNADIIHPYSSFPSERINELIAIDSKQHISSRKQIDKHITFNCEYCGNETEQLISKYNKSLTHCCSSSCSAKLRYRKPM